MFHTRLKSEDDATKQNIATQSQRANLWTSRGGWWDEFGDWEWHLYTIDTMYKIDN